MMARLRFVAIAYLLIWPAMVWGDGTAQMTLPCRMDCVTAVRVTWDPMLSHEEREAVADDLFRTILRTYALTGDNTPSMSITRGSDWVLHFLYRANCDQRFELTAAMLREMSDRPVVGVVALEIDPEGNVNPDEINIRGDSWRECDQPTTGQALPDSGNFYACRDSLFVYPIADGMVQLGDPIVSPGDVKQIVEREEPWNRATTWTIELSAKARERLDQRTSENPGLELAVHCGGAKVYRFTVLGPLVAIKLFIPWREDD